MPMIDVYSAEGTFANKHALAKDLAAAVMRWEKVPELSLFRKTLQPLSMTSLPVPRRMSTATKTTSGCRF